MDLSWPLKQVTAVCLIQNQIMVVLLELFEWANFFLGYLLLGHQVGLAQVVL